MIAKPAWMSKSFFHHDSCLETHKSTEEQLVDIMSINNDSVLKTVPDKELEDVNESQVVLSSQFLKKSMKHESNSKQHFKKIQLVLVSVPQEEQEVDPVTFYHGKYRLYHKQTKKGTTRTSLISLKHLRMETQHMTNSDDIFCFCLRLSQGSRSMELFSHDKAVIRKWVSMLSGYLVQHSFHQQFKVSKIIGKGHFAKVYVASRKHDNMCFAIKAFSKEYLYKLALGKESLLIEIEIMRQLNHPHILPLLEVHETENSLYLVMQLLKGGELLKALNQNKYSLDQIALTMGRLLDALAHMHSKNILHRDLKPDNLLLRDSSDITDVVIADFGLATYQPASSQIFKRCGTPGYVAPEILLFKDGNTFYDTKCDVFSLGCIFHIFLTGRKLFKAKNQKEVIILNRQCEVDFKSLEIVDPAALDLLQRMLTKDPLHRISAAEALKHPFIQETPGHKQKKNYFNNIHLEEEMVRGNSQGDKLQTSFGSFQLRPKGSKKQGQIDSIGSLNASRDVIRKEDSREKESDNDSIFKRQYQTTKKSLFQKQQLHNCE